MYEKLPDLRAARDRENELQGAIWTNVVAACRQAGAPAVTQVVPVLNQMFDIATTRVMAFKMHPPPIIFIMLGVLTLVSALLAAFAMGEAGSAVGFMWWASR